LQCGKTKKERKEIHTDYLIK